MNIHLFPYKLAIVMVLSLAMLERLALPMQGGFAGRELNTLFIDWEESEQSHAFLPLVVRDFGGGQPTVTETPPVETATSTPEPTNTPTPTQTQTPTTTPSKTIVPGRWQEVGAGSANGGGISQNDGSSGLPSLAIAPDGTPYVAWRDISGGDSEIYVRKFDGNMWVEVGEDSASGGGISNNGGASWYPSLDIAPDGTPYVAWQDDSNGNYEIYIRRFDGQAWVEVGTGSASDGGISNNGSASYVPSLAIAPNGVPYIAWGDDSTSDAEIFVLRYE